MHDDCPQHRPSWMAEYERLANLATQAGANVMRARARLRGQEGGHRKRTDRAIAKRREQAGGTLPDGPMPLLAVGRKALDRAQAELDDARAQREHVYNEISTHRNDCIACRTELDATHSLCDACGLRRADVADDVDAGELSPGVPWQRCAACRAAGLQVPA